MMQHASPYLAMGDNPTIFTDPLGLMDGTPLQVDGEVYLSGTTVYAERPPMWQLIFGSRQNMHDAAWEAQFFGKAAPGPAKKFSMLKYGEDVAARNRQLDRADAERRSLERDLAKVNNVNNGLGIALGVKTEMFTYAIAQNYKSASNSYDFHKLRPTQQAWRTTNTLGKFGSGMLKTTKVLGVVGNSLSIVTKGFEIYDKGVKNTTLRDVTDLSVNAAAVGAAIFMASNPIGWTIGAAALTYSIGTLIYDATKDEK